MITIIDKLYSQRIDGYSCGRNLRRNIITFEGDQRLELLWLRKMSAFDKGIENGDNFVGQNKFKC